MDTKDLERRNLLRRRAEKLAAPRPDNLKSEQNLEILSFMISGECFALPMAKVGSVTRCGNLCPIPRTPDYILGVANVNGELMTIVDLGPRFGLARCHLKDDSRVIVLENSIMKFGLFAEKVVGSETVTQHELNAPTQSVNGSEKYLLNMMSDGTILLNADGILSDTSLVVQEE